MYTSSVAGHAQTPPSSNPGESDILTLQKQDTSTLRLQKLCGITWFMEPPHFHFADMPAS
ncbi:hypothetical protein GFL91_01885 [Rhizobium leguminosarum bv. viciae]|uniref:Uncharacterized protein n=1 Tax=Rhizobium leguminosarum bv. viciae TaxID=387 RepID=A0A8I2GKY9_RHILV|nr:hypothetical protein [Rhizobium leguminosarum bv. viciae]